jgi:hypothetical protein
MEAIYNIDYNKPITWLIPPRLRSSILMYWVKALISPIDKLYGDFTRYRKDVLYRTSITPQVCYMEKVLNDTFDKTQRRITITDGFEYIVTLIHLDEALKPLPTYLEGTGHDEDIPIIHDDSAYMDSGCDFNVNIPFSLSQTDEMRLKSIINTYKLPSKRYKILYS